MRLLVTRYDQVPDKSYSVDFMQLSAVTQVDADTACQSVHKAFPDTRIFRLTTNRDCGYAYPVWTVYPVDSRCEFMEMVRLVDPSRLEVLGSEGLEDVSFSGLQKRPLTVAEAGALTCQWVEDLAVARETDVSDLEVEWRGAKDASARVRRRMTSLNWVTVTICVGCGVYYLIRSML